MKYFSFSKTAKPTKAKGKKHKICSLIKNPLKLSRLGKPQKNKNRSKKKMGNGIRWVSV